MPLRRRCALADAQSIDCDQPFHRITVRVPEAARMLSISRAAFYRLLNAGDIEAAKSGHSILVIVTSLDAYVERNLVRIASGIPD